VGDAMAMAMAWAMALADRKKTAVREAILELYAVLERDDEAHVRTLPGESRCCSCGSNRPTRHLAA
jgi:uncharacterized protein (UPF0212 family)